MHVLFSSYKGVPGMGPLYTPFEEVLRQSDIITLHCPLLASTRNMIAAPEFAQMQRRPLLINTARGGLVDEQALADALKQGQISGAGFDVVTTEPPPPDHPFMRLLDLPNFILTPPRGVVEPRGNPGAGRSTDGKHRAFLAWDSAPSGLRGRISPPVLTVNVYTEMRSNL
jgi:phosphoglycerate dehydrogenase-like enzyme